MKSTITAIVIAKNEEPRIALCLEALDWVDELVVVDNNSEDKTGEIAKKYKAKIIQSDEKNFSHLRELGASRSTSEWVLYIDADEKVNNELKKEIISTMESYLPGTPAGYFIKRDNYYLGNHRWPVGDKMQRLFLRTSLVGWHGEVHETADVNGDVGTLLHPLIHRTHRTLEEMVAKTNEWSEIEAKLRFDSGHPKIVWWRLIRVMFTGFYDSFIHQAGWRAGTAGWIESIFQAFSMFITYAKLWELQEKRVEGRG